MIKNILFVILILGIFMFWTQALQAKFGHIETTAIENPVVVELFTSQSCSSCPPADKVLGELAQNPNVIALGFHVTYWNHLHWKDTLSQEFSTERQRRYAAYRRSSRVYTPQMIVNGAQEFVGSNRDRLNKALQNTQPIAKIDLERTAENAVAINLPALSNDGNLNYTLRLFGVRSTESVKITRGENRGRSVTYHNGVLHQNVLDSWLGDADHRITQIPMDDRIDHIVVLAQAGGYGEIIAAGKLSLR